MKTDQKALALQAELHTATSAIQDLLKEDYYLVGLVFHKPDSNGDYVSAYIPSARMNALALQLSGKNTLEKEAMQTATASMVRMIADGLRDLAMQHIQSQASFSAGESKGLKASDN